MKNLISLIFIVLLLSCNQKHEDVQQITTNPSLKMQIDETIISQVIDKLIEKHGAKHKFRIDRGVNSVAEFWNSKDGSVEDFSNFCIQNFKSDKKEIEELFTTLLENTELINGHMNEITLGLREPMDLKWGKPSKLQLLYGAYDVSSHINDDFFNNKIALLINLNFPHYSLDEKAEFAKSWNRKEWAIAAAGDQFYERVPGSLKTEAGAISSDADNYIANYNIYMHNILDENGDRPFPEGMKLISHWNLRDELKSQYSNEEGQKQQELIYEIMLDIINQTIPVSLINDDTFTWDPVEDKIYENTKEIPYETEPNTRYIKLLNQFKIQQEIDKYNPYYKTFIERSFDKQMQMTQDQVEELFLKLLSSNQAKDAAKLVKVRLDRDLRPYDIWYDGFKARGSISPEKLDNITKSKYPDTQTFQQNLGDILLKLEFSNEQKDFLIDKITVDPARGAGHAWGAQMKGEKAHLRTRIGDDGMDYKGYNIAVHEFGHNVEQTYSLYKMDFYLLSGVPNNAFTEAIAFLFQSRDLKILNLEESNEMKKYLETLDTFWSAYEIMGVAVVDMRVWKWLYDNPNATADQLKDAVIRISKEVWNEFFAPNFGVQDSPILGIYSHMISYPLYLAAYPLGRLIEFQIEENIKDKNFGSEIERIAKIGRVTPNVWMQKAVGNDLSVEPLLKETESAINKLKE